MHNCGLIHFQDAVSFAMSPDRLISPAVQLFRQLVSLPIGATCIAEHQFPHKSGESSVLDCFKNCAVARLAAMIRYTGPAMTLANMRKIGARSIEARAANASGPAVTSTSSPLYSNLRRALVDFVYMMQIEHRGERDQNNAN